MPMLDEYCRIEGQMGSPIRAHLADWRSPDQVPANLRIRAMRNWDRGLRVSINGPYHLNPHHSARSRLCIGYENSGIRLAARLV